MRDINQLGDRAYHVYIRQKINNRYNSTNYGISGCNINRYFYNDGNVLSYVYYGLEIEKLRYIIGIDFSLYEMEFYL